MITIYVDNIGASGDLRCCFSNRDPVPAQKLSDAQLTCLAPSHEPGLVPLSLVNGVGYTSNVIQFQFLPPIVFDSITPWAASSSGGSELAVHGTGISAHSIIECRFTSPPISSSSTEGPVSDEVLIARGSFHSEVSARCTTPSSWRKYPSTGIWTVSVGVNGEIAILGEIQYLDEVQ